MNPDTTKLIEQQWENLPDDIRGVVTSSDFRGRIINISKKYSFDQSGVESLVLETLLVLLGLEYTKDYLRNLKNNCGLDEEMTRNIGGEISETIFKPVSDSLRNMNVAMETVDSPPVRVVPQTPQTPRPIPSPISIPNDLSAKVDNAIPKKDAMVIMPAVSTNDTITDKLTSVIRLPKEHKFVGGSVDKKPETPVIRGYDREDPYREPV